MAIELDEILVPEDTVAAIIADVFQLAGALRRWGDGVAAKSGQTQARWQVLSAASPANRTVPQIARRLGISRQGVQRVADLLVEEGRARYVWNRDHQSSPLLRLATRGKDRLDKMNRAASAMHKELAGGLHADDLQAAAVVLRKFSVQIERDLRPEEE